MTAVPASLGKGLIFVGILIAAVGVLFLLSDKFGWIGRLPGDISIRRGNFTVYIPLATCLVISVVISLLVWLFRR